MYRLDGRLVLSPTDLVGYLHCAHLTELSVAVADGRLTAPPENDPEADLLQRKGNEHERAWLEHLESLKMAVTTVVDDGDLAARAQRTLDAMRAGSQVVYQATFTGEADGHLWRGHADFVMRVDTPSDLGEFSYRPADTKLARRVTPAAVLQLSEYAEQIERVQGVCVSHISVVMGDGREEMLRRSDFGAYHRAARKRFTAALDAGIVAEPMPVSHCAVCAWAPACDQWREDADHLTLVAGLGAEQARKLRTAGVPTMTALSRLGDGPSTSVPGVGGATVERLVAQARLQVQARADGSGPPPYELLEPGDPATGLASLPAPSPGDLFFDIEADPWVANGGLEYLLGVGWVEGDGSFGYRALWGHDRAEEKAAFEELIDLIVARRSTDPGMHVYHYAGYERDALGRLMGRHGTREAEVDDLLRGGVLVDLFRVLRQSVRVGTPSYSLKKIEALYRPRPRTEAITDGGSSIVEYEKYIETDDTAILDRLAEYNEVDCESTLELRDWLEARRDEFEARHGLDLGRPVVGPADVPETVVAEEGTVAVLAAALRGDEGAGDRQDEDRDVAEGRRLLADLLSWHRREEKPEWWRYYDRVQRCDEDDLFDDTEAVAGLEFVEEARVEKKSIVYRYRFNPEQECKIRPGQKLADPAAEREHLPDWPDQPVIKPRGPGSLEAFDPVAGTLELKRGSKRVHPRCLIPGIPVPTKDQKTALQRLASSVVEHGLDGPGPYRAVRDFVLRRPPRLAGGLTAGPLVHGDAADAAVDLATSLAGGILAVQGPPGSGKTRAAARMAVALVGSGRRPVGVTGHSHAVISGLVSAILEEADRQGVTLRVSQKSDGERGVDDPRVEIRGNVDAVVRDIDDGVDLVAGTAWLFAPEQLDRRLDVLIVDEAGQLSLANTVAAGTSARNLVLVGDPQQLAQPSKGSHPPGADASALGHMLDGKPTISADRGVFLDRTHRLHPDICKFVSEIAYDDKLLPEAGTELQSIGGEGALSGSGLRWLPVEHDDDRVRSPEEAAAVARCFDSLVGRTVTERGGQTKLLTAADILVVAPYNAQVGELTRTLPAGARVGTVDLFQGKEADVVLVSLTTSSAEDIPRGMEFLYSTHRLNVAVSRARALVVLVGSPRLLAVECHTVEQMRLANALCLYVEMARQITVP